MEPISIGRVTNVSQQLKLNPSRLKRLLLIGLFGAIASLTVSSACDHAQHNFVSKLRSDVRTLNTAVLLYRAGGGDLGGFTDPEHVLLKLKSLGPADGSVSVIDPSVQCDYMLLPESKSNAPRVFWDAASQSFVITNAGQGGIRGFYFEGDPGGESSLWERHLRIHQH